jgi:peptidoglycan hydrolase-like protein with peptidoglycan-binding domain
MTVVKKGSRGAVVTELQHILRELDYNIPVTGIFDTATLKAVKSFQSRHLDKHNMPLEIDGEVGELTWWALQNPRNVVQGVAIDYGVMPVKETGESAMGRAALQFAISELNNGAGEEGGNNKGPWVKKYLQPTGLAEGNSWCAAFISWCFLQAAGDDKKKMPFKYTAGAKNIYNQLKQKSLIYDANRTTPLPGDIITWWRVSAASGFGHIAIVHHYGDGFLYTLEGNKAANVAGFSYVKTRMDKVLGYGRIS